MQFKEVIGQEPVKQHLVDMVHSNRLSHALLFLSKEGAGGLPMALAFAQYLVCEKVQRSGADTGPSLFGDAAPVETLIPADSCGVCSGCLKAAQMVHPDIHFSFPTIAKKDSSSTSIVCNDWIVEYREFVKNMPYGNSFDWLQFLNAENKQGNITAAECNDIIRKLSVKSFESGYKVLIMWMPEYLGKEGNKLLKIIEEPPANTVYILVAENENLILQTILSRTQLIRVPALEAEDISTALQQKAGIEATSARQIAIMAEGSYREAIQMLNHASEDWLSILREWLNAILRNGPVAQVKWVEEVSKLGREKQKQFLKYCTHLVEFSIRAQSIPGGADNLPEGERDFANRLNKIADFSQLDAIVTEFDKAAYHIERNANAKMLFHALTIRLAYIIKDKSLILIG